MLVSLIALMLLAQPVTAVAPIVAAGAGVVGGGAVGGAGGFVAGSYLADDTEGMGAEEVEEELFRDALSYQDNVDESTTWAENQITDAEQVSIGHAQYGISTALQDGDSESQLVQDGQDASDDHLSLILENHINSWNSEVEEIHSAAQVDIDTEGTSNEAFHVLTPEDTESEDQFYWTEDTEVEYQTIELPNGDEEEMATTLTDMDRDMTSSVDINLVDGDESDSSVVDDGQSTLHATDPSVDDDEDDEDSILLLDADEHHVSIMDDLESVAETVNDEVEQYAEDIYGEFDGEDVDHIDVVDPSVLSTMGDDTDGLTFATTAATAAGYATSADAPATFTVTEEDGEEVETSGLLTTRAEPDTDTDEGQTAWLEGETYDADDHDEDIMIQAIDDDGNVEPWVLEEGDEMTIESIEDGDYIEYDEHSYSEYDSSEYIDELEAQNERLADMLEERQGGGWASSIWDDLADAIGTPGAIAVVIAGIVGLGVAATVFIRAATP